jgi:F-type H+-transporting ATPase subunit epsilon
VREKAFRCEVLSPEGKVFEGETTKLVATALDGEVGVLYNHAPLVAALGRGSLRITAPGGAVRRFVASGGFLEVFKNRATILTDSIEPVE